jgi:hypothetical protein
MDMVLEILKFDDRFRIRNGIPIGRISKTDTRVSIIKQNIYFNLQASIDYVCRENLFLIKNVFGYPTNTKYYIDFYITNNLWRYMEFTINSDVIEKIPDNYDDTTYADTYKELGDYIMHTYFQEKRYLTVSRSFTLYCQRYVSYFMKRVLYYNNDNGIHTIVRSKQNM